MRKHQLSTNESQVLPLSNRKSGFLQALAAYDKAISINSKDSLLHKKRGDTLFFLDRCPEAIDSFNQAISINPLGFYYRKRALIYLALGELEKAEADYNRFRELDSTELSSENFDPVNSVFLNRNSLQQWYQSVQNSEEQFDDFMGRTKCS